MIDDMVTFLVLAVTSFALANQFLPNAFWKPTPETGESIAESQECKDKLPPMKLFDVRMRVAEKLFTEGSAIIIFSKPEGCVRVGETFPFEGIKNPWADTSPLAEHGLSGTIKIEEIKLVEFANLTEGHKLHLETKLKKDRNNITGKFQVLKIKTLTKNPIKNEAREVDIE